MSVVGLKTSHWPRANILTSNWPLTGTDSPSNTLRWQRLSQLDKFVHIFVHFYHLSKLLRDENYIKRSLLQSPLSETQFCLANISTPKSRTEMVLYSKFAYGSQFSGEKNYLEIRYWVADILSKNPVSFFLGHPVLQN